MTKIGGPNAGSLAPGVRQRAKKKLYLSTEDQHSVECLGFQYIFWEYLRMFYSQHSFLVNVRFRSGLVKKSGVKFTKVIILFFGPHYLYFFLVGSPNDQLLNIHS